MYWRISVKGDSSRAHSSNKDSVRMITFIGMAVMSKAEFGSAYIDHVLGRVNMPGLDQLHSAVPE